MLQVCSVQLKAILRISFKDIYDITASRMHLKYLRLGKKTISLNGCTINEILPCEKKLQVFSA